MKRNTYNESINRSISIYIDNIQTYIKCFEPNLHKQSPDDITTFVHSELVCTE